MQRQYIIILVAALVSVVAIGLPFVLGDGALLSDQWHNAARFTARVGFPIFLSAYSASALVRLWPSRWTRALMHDRRQWGLAFTLTHTVHLIALVMYIVVSGTVRNFLDAITLGVAAPGYLVMYAMAFTSNNASMKAMGKNWKRLHSFGIHLLWLNFAGSYALKFFRIDGEPVGASYIYFPLAMLALILRIIASHRSKARLTAIEPTKANASIEAR
jgi:methionine sulfoxide reductase heme-binding subunit